MRGGTHEKLEGRVLGGRYRCVSLLAKGGMGAVYEGVQEGLGRRIAIKVLHPLLGKDREQLIRFEREAHAAASLAHPNVVQIIDFFTDEGDLPVLVMEYIEGRSLAELILGEGPLEIGRSVLIVTQVLAALEAAHGIGIVHRDLKPGNVMITDVTGAGEVVKLVDFGLAKMTEGTGYTRLTMTGLSIGTPIFMSPEQALGEKTVDHRTDVYAAGLLLYGAVTKTLPFPHDAPPAELLKLITTGPAPSILDINPDLPEQLDVVVRKAMAKDRNVRFQTARDLAQALVQWLPAHAESLMPGFVQRLSHLEMEAASTVPAKPSTVQMESARSDSRHTDPAFSTGELVAAGLPRKARSSLRPLWIGSGVLVALLLGAGAVYAGLTASQSVVADEVEPEPAGQEPRAEGPEPDPPQPSETPTVLEESADAGHSATPQEADDEASTETVSTKRTPRRRPRRNMSTSRPTPSQPTSMETTTMETTTMETTTMETSTMEPPPAMVEPAVETTTMEPTPTMQTVMSGTVVPQADQNPR